MTLDSRSIQYFRPVCRVLRARFLCGADARQSQGISLEDTGEDTSRLEEMWIISEEFQDLRGDDVDCRLYDRGNSNGLFVKVVAELRHSFLEV